MHFMKSRLFRYHGLSIVLLVLFISMVVIQLITGHRVWNSELSEHQQPTLSFGQYLRSGHCIEALAENWESEFLQMGSFVWLTACLYQKGSPESHDPDETHDEDERPPQADSPYPVKRGGWMLSLYRRSLTLTFLGLFLISFLLHAAGGASAYSRDQIAHGEAPVNMLQYMATARFWFESMQNWQSEFLAMLAMVVLSIFLRQEGSPESKPVAAPHWANE
jgi:hypothetical protein